jgi:SSS family solute:Na+ symporter
LLPELADPVQAFPELARITLPPLALGFFYLAMIATVMSSVDSYGFIAAGTVGRDLIWRLRGEQGEDRLPFYTRIGLVITALFAGALALANPSVIGLWHAVGSITTPALLLPVGTALLGRGRIAPRWTGTAMACAPAVSLAWVLIKSFPPGGGTGGYPFSIEPIYAGLAVSLSIYIAGWATRSRPNDRTGGAVSGAP